MEHELSAPEPAQVGLPFGPPALTHDEGMEVGQVEFVEEAFRGPGVAAHGSLAEPKGVEVDEAVDALPSRRGVDQELA